MSKLTVYHGSSKIIKTPIFGVGNKNNDYGLGFYCTESEELAKEWACTFELDGYANKYTLDMKNLTVISLTSGEYNILNWLYVLLQNRKFRMDGDIALQAKEYIDEHFAVDYKGYDIIKGYRADDSYFSFAQDFVSGVISLQKLAQAMRLGKLGEQIVLKSPKAFAQIQFVGYENADAEEYYIKKNEREREARRQYRRNKKEQADVNELFILDIMREEIKNGDARLSV